MKYLIVGRPGSGKGNMMAKLAESGFKCAPAYKEWPTDSASIAKMLAEADVAAVYPSTVKKLAKLMPDTSFVILHMKGGMMLLDADLAMEFTDYEKASANDAAIAPNVMEVFEINNGANEDEIAKGVKEMKKFTHTAQNVRAVIHALRSHKLIKTDASMKIILHQEMPIGGGIPYAVSEDVFTTMAVCAPENFAKMFVKYCSMNEVRLGPPIA